MQEAIKDGLEIRHLTDLKQIRQIYTEHLMRDFPPDECTPWVYVEEMVRKCAYDCYGLFRGEEFLGYTFFMKQTVAGKTYYLFDYFAITEQHRNAGVGTGFLQRIGACIPDADCVLRGRIPID